MGKSNKKRTNFNDEIQRFCKDIRDKLKTNGIDNPKEQPINLEGATFTDLGGPRVQSMKYNEVIKELDADKGIK